MFKNKKIFAVILFLAMLLPMVSFAATNFGANISGQGKGFSFSLGLGSGGGGGWGGALSNLSGTGLPQGSILGIIENIMYWLLAILGIAGVIGFAISGIIYMISTGDETMVERAKTAMKWSIVGVVVGLVGVVAIQAINMALNASPGF